MSAICFAEFYRRYMPPAMCEVAYMRSAAQLAHIIAGAVALARADGIHKPDLYRNFQVRGLSVEDFEIILAGLEQAGRVHQRKGRIFPGFPVP